MLKPHNLTRKLANYLCAEKFMLISIIRMMSNIDLLLIVNTIIGVSLMMRSLRANCCY